MSNQNTMPQPTSPEQLQEVLMAMLNPDNSTRRAAEACLETFFQNPACVPAMMQQITQSSNQSARQMAAVLLRKKLSAGLWRENIKHWKSIEASLLRRLVEENVWPVRKALAALATRVAKLTIPDGDWPELIPFLVSLMQKPQENLRTVGMLLWRGLGENLGQHMVQNLSSFAQVVNKGLQDPATRVRIEAFRAMEGVVPYLDTKEHVTIYGKLIPLAVKSAQDILKREPEDAQAALELFNSLADSPVPVLDPFLVPLTKFMLEVAVKSTELNLADPAMQFVQSVVDYKPTRLLRSKLVPDVLRAAFFFVVKEDDDPFDPNEVTSQRIGVAMLASLVENVPYKHVLNPCLQTSVKLIKSSSPHERRGGMAIIAAIAEGFSLLLQDFLPQLLSATLGLLQDKHPMVRVSACVCLLQLCDHLQPEICQHHERLVPAMVKVLDRPNEHRMVRVKMASALCAFVENLEDKEAVGRYANPLMKKFGQLLSSGDVDLKETGIGGIQAVAIAAEEKFMPFYKESVNALFHFMSKKDDTELKLRARATECIGCIAVAVGAKAFGPCVPKLLALADENLTMEYFNLSEATFRMYANLATCLGEEFNRILPKIHAYAVKCLESLDGVEIRHAGGEMSAFHQEDAFENEDDLLKQMEYSIRSGAVDEKAAAIQSMTSYIENCGRGFLPFVKKTVDVCKETLEYPHEFVRHGVAAVLHELINLAHKLFPNQNGDNKMQNGAQAIVGSTLPLLLEMIKSEPDKGCCAEAVQGVKTCVEAFGIPILTVAGKPLIDCLEMCLQEKAPCQLYHGEEEDEKDETDHDEILIDQVTDLLSAVAKALGPKFEPIFVKMIKHLLKFNGSNRSGPDRIMAIGTIGDIAEEMKGAIKNYLKTLFPIIIQALTDSEVGVRRNAAYTIGVLALGGGKEGGGAFFPKAIESLHRLLNIPNEKKGDMAFEACRDNAVSAISKIMAQDPAIMRNPQVIRAFMSGLPLMNDHVEGKQVYPIMAQLIQTQQDLMRTHFAHALYTCGKVFSTEEVENNIKQGLVPVAKFLGKALGSDQLNAVQRLLSAEERQRLQSLLNG